jgi:hypothetical protein
VKLIDLNHRKNWHDWFAWRPVIVQSVAGRFELIWWETVRRRYVDVGSLDYDYQWQHCLPGEEW